MIGLFSIVPIIRQHYESLVSDSTKIGIAILFFLVPILISGVVVYFEILINSRFTQALIPVLAILVGFTMNALILLMRDPEVESDDMCEEGEEGGLNEEELTLITNTRNHTMYAMIFGLTLLAVVATLFLLLELELFGGIFDRVASFIVYTATIHYVMTLFLLPARMYTLVEIRQ